MNLIFWNSKLNYHGIAGLRFATPAMTGLPKLEALNILLWNQKIFNFQFSILN